MKTNQKHLVAKLTGLLTNGIDVYFSRFDAKPSLEDVNDEVWKLIIDKMHTKHVSLLNAIVTEPSASFKTFEAIFRKSMLWSEKLFKNLLLRNALARKNYPFLDPSTDIWNIEFIQELISFANLAC
jgi:hypothetical protein